MSQFTLRNLREISNDPLTKFTNEIAKKLSKFLTQNQIEQLEDKEDIYSDGQDLETVIKFHDELQSQKQFDFVTEYYPPTEPDGDLVKLWIRGNNLGNQINDISGFANHGALYGEPMLVDGAPFDYGIHNFGVKSVALRLNRTTSDYVNEEYISISDNTSLQLSGIATGMSYFIRFKIGDIEQQGSISRTLVEKIDDSTPNNGVLIEVTNTGRIRFFVKRGGTEYNFQTTTGVITTDTVYEIFCTYAVSGNAAHVYINNSDMTLTTPPVSPVWHTTLTNHDLSLFRRGAGTSGGYVYGDLYDFLIYKEKVVSATEVGHHYTNKWTIADIPFGQVMVTNYWATYGETPPPPPISFSASSFTTGTSFN